MKALRWSLLLCLLAASPAADSVLPRSPAAVKAMKKRDDAVARAADIYREATATADRILVSELKGAQAAEMRQGDLAEANAIDARLQRAAAELAADGPPAPSIVGRWGWNGRDTSDLTFEADGAATCVWWNGKKAHWFAAEERTFRVVQPDGHPVTMTLTSDGKHCLWVDGDGQVNWMVRHEAELKRGH